MAKAKNTIFIIEDELDILHLYKTALTQADFEVVGISSGKEAMEKIKAIQEGKASKPNLVLLDLVLPDINGLEILNALRQNGVTKDILVDIFSNYTSEALLNMKYIRPDKFILKSATTPTQLIQELSEQLKIAPQ